MNKFGVTRGVIRARIASDGSTARASVALQGRLSRLLMTSLALIAPAGCLQPATNLGAVPKPILYPLPPAAPRVAYLTSIDGTAFMGQQTSPVARFLFGRDSETAGTITKPFGLAAGDETLLVCDTRQNVVHVFDFKSGQAGRMGDTGRGRLLKPVAVAMDDQANRYVADAGRGEVVVFSSQGVPIRALTAEGGSGETDFKPVAVAYRDGRLYVVNAAAHRVEVLDPESGALIRTIGERGSEPGQMLFPNGLAIDAEGRILVTDMLNCRVQVFAPDGRLVRSFGRPGDRAGEFSRPKHLAVGTDGTVFVVDAAFQRVQVFDSQGRVLMLFGGPGNEPGGLILPAGVCVDRTLLPHFADWMPAGFDAEYLIFVSDQFGKHKIAVYAFGAMASP